ncbi:Oligopeptide-binding protein AppA precursor [Jeotgalicoccus saudimassiliensis]|uniref:Oligopeptide-binding protein AppA n=1 Tax=Jeotgalicoccus saudimassiliensis TaxID=1461582 RepID=A0A078LYS9_9STAP|nr:oligopeptide ABC transporter substrate-binding protein [Jeotgalicoccus saudimassiliensis]CDZ99189.1 Oligopeptide-binding protein AppA precursor [Jeotgalicoccus saudimassiliensis]
MTKISWSRFLFLMTLALVLALAACGGDSSEEDTSSDDASSEESGDEESADEGDSASGDVYNYEDFAKTVSNTGEPSGEGTLNIGYSSDTPFEGTLNWAFYQGAPDADMMAHFDEAVLAMDADFQYTNEGAVQYEMNEEDNTVTFTVRDGVKWHDGEPLKIQDYVSSYEIIGHPDYDGVRGSTDGFTLIEGYEEYRNGEADSISGIEIVDEKTAVFTYTELAPSLTAGGFWSYAFPTHHYEGMEVSEMAAAPQTRENPIGIGPYKVDSIVSGESITMSKFEDYWRGEPGLSEVTVRVIAPSSIASAVESGDVDIAKSFPTDQYPDVADMEGVEWLANIDGAYTYIGFKLGSWDAEAGKVDYKPEEMKMGDVELRRAMWHAIDNDAIGERFYNGLRWKATSLITPYHANWHEEVDVPAYDPEEANRILDEAGYEDVDGDGMREDKEGEPLSINFASMSGGDIAEPLANYYIQSWRDIGLNVELTNGRLIEFNTFYDMVENDDPEIDIYQGAWGVGSDVDPSGLYGEDAPFNYTRYASEENTDLLTKGNSQEALDVEYRKDIYNQWSELMAEEIPVIPTLYRAFVTPVNERVINYSEDYEWNEDLLWYRVGVEDAE